MNIKKYKYAFTIIMLGLLTTSAFFMRLNNATSQHSKSIDEIVYFRMAQQVSVNAADYNTIAYGKDLTDRGRELPQYFFHPLFKHPPLFTYMNASLMKIFGPSMNVANYMSILMGVLLIPLGYWLARMVFSESVALIAAILIYIDPVLMITSQKIWMDTSLAFFALLSICFFVYAIKNKKEEMFILSSFATACGVLTKYTGILPVFVVVTYAALYNKALFKSKSYMFSLTIPFFALIPWGIWNYRVYGTDFMLKTFTEHHSHVMRFFHPNNLWVLLLFIAIFGSIYFISSKKANSLKAEDQKSNKDGTTYVITKIAFILFLLFLLIEPLKHILNWNILPNVSWASGGFPLDNTPFFYIRQLVYFSPIYVLGFLGLSFLDDEHDLVATLRLSVIVILGFFIVWQNYQSRYVVPMISFALILSAGLVGKIFNNKLIEDNFLLRLISRVGLFTFVLFAIQKIMFINEVLSFTHDFCYY